MAKEVLKVRIVDNKEAIMGEMKAKLHGWLEAIGEDAASTAADKAPVDTGRLKNSISHAVDDENTCVYIGTNVEYAPYHEFGTGKYTAGGRPTPWSYQDEKGEWHRTSGVPAKHFIQFGATAHQDEYKAMLEHALRE